MAKRRKRRKWSDDEKRMICAQTVFAGVSVAQVARRYDLNANQIFNWLKDPKFAPNDHPEEDEAKFLPVEVIAEPTRGEATPETAGLIELELANGHRLRISGSYDPDAVARLVRHLT
ncbi:MAG: transposase [Pseudomonadota bacterium]